MPTFTTNYNFNLPTVSGDVDTWGDLINANWEALDDQLAGMPTLDGPNVFTNTFTIRSDTEDPNLGPDLDLDRVSTPAANNLIGRLRVRGKNSADATVNYGVIYTRILDPTAGSEAAEIVFGRAIAAGSVEGMSLAAGLYMSGASGGDQGVGTINVQDLYINGAHIEHEKGVCTPTVAGGTSAGSGTYSIQRGRYTLIGNRVTVDIHLSYSGHTGTGVKTIAGLPFTSASNVDATCAVYVSNLTLDTGKVACARVTRGSAIINMYQTPVGGGSGALVAMDAAAEITLTVSYEIA